MMIRRILPYSALHFINDAISGYLIGSTALESKSDFQTALAILMYNVIAFGGQWFFAHYARPIKSSRFWIVVAIMLLMSAFALFPFVWKISILMIGVSSAIIHVEGAVASYAISPTSKSLGSFAAPGIIGLMLGGWLSTLPFSSGWILLSFSAIMALYFLRYTGGEHPQVAHIHEPEAPDSHDLWMVILLSAIALRSAVWNVFQMVELNHYEALAWIAFAAAAGKIAGGYLSHWIGERNYNLFALMASLPLLTLLRHHTIAFLTGIFLMQSTFGSTARMMMQNFRKSPASGAAHAFGTPLLVGGILYLTPWSAWLCKPVGVIVLLTSSILLLYFEKKKSAQKWVHKKSRLKETAL